MAFTLNAPTTAATPTHPVYQAQGTTFGQYAPPLSPTRKPASTATFRDANDIANTAPAADITGTAGIAETTNQTRESIAGTGRSSPPDTVYHRAERSQRSTEATDLDVSSEPFVPRKPRTGAEYSSRSLHGSTRQRGRYNRGRWSRPSYNRRAQSKSEPTGDAHGDN